jgi:16S rRNA (cytidine1402-2'-O)-methyltransferase
MVNVYLIPCVIADGATETIPSYILQAVNNSQVIFAENERTARRYLKLLDREIVIDNYEWHTIHKVEEEQLQIFEQAILAKKNIAIISESGCPGVADPGQKLIAKAQKLQCIIKPLVGPSSILLALMASGMNGQQFEFVGYLPIDNAEKVKAIKALEIASKKNNSTKIFIETPYRNNTLVDTLLKNCQPNTQLCIALSITASNESILTKTIKAWTQQKPELPKLPAIFLLYAGE